MARYNTSLASATITGTTTIGTPNSGAFTALTGTAPYTVTLPTPTLFPGTNQTFYNATSGIITLSSPSGNFVGTGASGASSTSVFAGNVVSVTSDGTNYIVISEDGSAMTATTGAFSGNVTVSGILTVQAGGGVSMAPSSAGNIDNVAIGATARSSGAFTTLAANGQVSLTANTASSSTSTGSLVVTGGLGVSGTINATSVVASLTGTIQTAAQPNITSTGSLTTPGLNVDSGTLYVDITNDRVGVGTTGPQTVLELATTATVNSSPYSQIKHLTLSRQENTRYNAYAGFGDQFGGNTFGWRFGTVNNSTDYPTLYMVNGSVGIATPTTPVSPLQVNATTSMASSGSVTDILSLTDNNGVSNGVTGARIGLTISAQSDISDRRIGIYATSNSANFNVPDVTFWASGQGVAYRELVRFSAQNGNVGINTGANPAGKLHIVNSSVGGIGSVPSGTSALIDSGSFNYLTFRNTADNATNAGIAFQDNNIGGYLVFRNYDVNNSSISDRMFLAGYQGVNIQYGTADSIDVNARTNVAKFDSTGLSVVSGSLTVSDLNFNLGSEFQSVSRSYTAPGSGPREIFRVPSSWLCTNGIFSLSATRGSFVHGSMWSWTTTHNGSGQGTLTMLSSGNYTNITVYLDVESGGGAVISADWGAQEGFQVTILKMSGGAISFASNGTDWSSPEAGRTRYSKATLANGFKAQNGAFDGSLSKGSGSFRIDHPLPELTETHALVHSFIEGPQADLIYRGRVDLVAGHAEVNIDTAADMTGGTFQALCRDVQCFTTNESDWTAVRGSVTGNILTIEAESNSATSSVSWLVIGERKDKHMYDTEWTDDSGKVIVEPLKNPVQTDFPPYPESVNTSEDTNGTL